MSMKRHALAFLVSTAACAAPLATLPPSDNYVMVEGSQPRLTSDEQKLFEAINKELSRVGLPQATLGSYEQNAAAIMANAALARVWRGSGRSIAEQNPQEIAPPVSDQEQINGKHEVANGRLASLTDEEDDTEVSHLHTGQHLTANGIPQSVRVKIFSEVYAKTSLDSDDLRTLVRSIRPHSMHGELRVGVAMLPTGDADKRIFVAAMRDQVFDLTKGPPRYGSPGMTFEVAGTAVERGLKSIKLALLGPDGKVLLGRAPVDLQGNFSTSVTIPNAPGLYQFGAARDEGSRNEVNVPIFVGISPTPWPVTPDPKETPVDGTRSVAQKLANSIAEWRHSHGLSVVPIDANLSAFAKACATRRGKAEDAMVGDGAGTPDTQIDGEWKDDVRAAGYDPATTKGRWQIVGQDYANDFFARFPGSAFAAASLSSPTVEKVGLGVVLVPNEVTKDDTLVRYAIEWVIQDPTPPTWEPPHPTAGSITQPLTVAIRADGSTSVDGAQVNEALLKQRLDQAKAVNADVTVVLQVEQGAKPELIQHVTDLVKGEGIVSIVSHPPEPPAVPPAPSPAPVKTW
jgi:uncharacterized protein YkwD